MINVSIWMYRMKAAEEGVEEWCDENVDKKV